MRNRILLCSLLSLTLASAAAGAERAALRSAMNSIIATDLQTHVDVLADDAFEGREAGSRGGRAAGTYLVRHFQQQGLQGAGDDGGYVQAFGDGYRNVLGLLEGSDPELKSQVIVVGAHYDHVGYGDSTNSYGPFGYVHNGADDNASGVAGLLELVDAFDKLDLPPKRSILFAFWDGEEKGLLGSQHWVGHPTISLEQVALAINVDMIGRMRNQQLEIYGSRTASGLRRLISENNPQGAVQIEFSWELKSNSDHYSFVEQDIPALMFHTGLHEDYHRPSDDAHLVNARGMQAAARLMFHVTFAAADRWEVRDFRSASRDENPAARELLERPRPPMQPRLGIRWQPDSTDDGSIVVTSVEPGTAAHRAALREGDRLVRFAGQEPGDSEAFRQSVLFAESPVEVEVERSGEEQTLVLPVELDGKPSRLGISWREDRGEPGTVVVTRVVPGSPARLAGIRTRDRIYRVEGRRFADTAELLELVMTLPGPLQLTIERRGQLQTVELDVPDWTGR